MCKQVVKGHMAIERPIRRARHRIDKVLTKQIVTKFREHGDTIMADVCVLAYSCGFRVNSELLPATFRGPHSWWRFNDQKDLRVTLTKRKNRQSEPTLIVRHCECAIDADMCPHKAASRTLRVCMDEGKNLLFPRLTYTGATGKLRRCLHTIGVAEAASYSFHAFRRGLAHDLLIAKTPLRDVLAACDWRSNAFAWYMGRGEIDAEAVLAAAAELSDDDPVG